MPFSFYERLTLFATLFLSVGLTAFTREVSVLFWAGTMVALALAIFQQSKGRAPLIGNATLPTVLVVAFSVADLFYIAPNFLVATVDLVLLLLAIKALSGHRVGDNLQMLGLSFLLVLAAAVITVDAMFGLLFLCYIFAGLSAMVLQNLRGHWEAAGGETELLGRRRGVLGRAFAVAIAALCVGVLMFTLVLYFAFPRVGLRLWRADINLTSRTSGFSETVRLNDVGRIRTNPAIALRVEYGGAKLPPETSPLRRLRGVVLDEFDGSTWHDAVGKVQPIAPQGRFNWVFRAAEKTTRLHISPDANYANMVFAPQGLVALRGGFSTVGVSSLGDLVVERGNKGRQGYELEIGAPEPDQSAPVAAHLVVPDNVTPRMRALVREWGRGLSGTALAERLTLRLTTELGYTTELADETAASPLDRFLFETKEGHCELFAASLAVLLRIQGVPTRLVNGFLGGDEWDGASVVFRDLHAHSWVEAYFPELGWVEFDPTPAATDALTWKQEALRRYFDALTRVRLFWGRWFIDYDFATQKDIVSGFQKASDNIGAKLEIDGAKRLRELFRAHFFQIVLGGAFLSVLAFLLWRPWRDKHVDQGRLTRLYRKRLRLAEKLQVRAKGQTPLQFAQQISRSKERWHDFYVYTELYYKLRYGEGTANDALLFLEMHAKVPKRD